MNKYIEKVGTKVKKHAPEIFISVGIAGVATGTVMACKATTKINDILDNRKEELEKIEEGITTLDSEEYTEEDAKKDRQIVNAKAGVALFKLYAPAVTITSISLAMIIQAHRIMNRRNAALSAAYLTLNKTYKEYQDRVVEKIGEDANQELIYGYKTKKVKIKEKDPETDKEVKVEKNIKVKDKASQGTFNYVFDESNPLYKTDATYNDIFLHSVETYANELLKSRRHLFLNEVFDELGMERTKEGQVLGWYYDETSEKFNNFVDFGINEVAYDDGEGGYYFRHELNFNPDGNILELI